MLASTGIHTTHSAGKAADVLAVRELQASLRLAAAVCITNLLTSPTRLASCGHCTPARYNSHGCYVCRLFLL